MPLSPFFSPDLATLPLLCLPPLPRPGPSGCWEWCSRCRWGWASPSSSTSSATAELLPALFLVDTAHTQAAWPSVVTFQHGLGFFPEQPKGFELIGCAPTPQQDARSASWGRLCMVHKRGVRCMQGGPWLYTQQPPVSVTSGASWWGVLMGPLQAKVIRDGAACTVKCCPWSHALLCPQGLGSQGRGFIGHTCKLKGCVLGLRAVPLSASRKHGHGLSLPLHGRSILFGVPCCL